MLLVGAGPLVAYINRKDLTTSLAQRYSAAGDLIQTDVLTTDLARIADLVRQYRSFPLGIADASVVALAERLGITEVATLDHRHFRAIRPRHCQALTLLP